MKRIILFFFLSVSFLSYADPDEIVLTPTNPIKDRGDSYNVSPLAFYDRDTEVIIIDGTGAASYYVVEITSAVNGYYEFYTIVNGTYDTFDAYALTAGTHVITITSPLGDAYEGTFTTY